MITKHSHDRSHSLHKYISTHEIIHKRDLLSFSITRVTHVLHRYCLTHNIKIVQINSTTWKKTTEDVDIRKLLVNRQKSLVSRHYSSQEKEDALSLTWELFAQKYPTRSKASYLNQHYKMLKKNAPSIKRGGKWKPRKSAKVA